MCYFLLTGRGYVGNDQVYTKYNRSGPTYEASSIAPSNDNNEASWYQRTQSEEDQASNQQTSFAAPFNAASKFPLGRGRGRGRGMPSATKPGL